jgi:hypothetical protein
LRAKIWIFSKDLIDFAPKESGHGWYKETSWSLYRKKIWIKFTLTPSLKKYSHTHYSSNLKKDPILFTGLKNYLLERSLFQESIDWRTTLSNFWLTKDKKNRQIPSRTTKKFLCLSFPALIKSLKSIGKSYKEMNNWIDMKGEFSHH